MKINRAHALLGGLAIALVSGVLAQTGTGVQGNGVQGGGARPAGSTYSIQYKASATALGGTGPGTSGQILTSNGAGAAPTFKPAPAGGVTSVGLTMPAVFSVTGSPVTSSGTLAVAAAGTSGGIPYFDSATSLASSGALTANRLVLGGGAAASPTVLGSLGTTTTLLHGNASGAPTFAAASLTADVSGTLPVANGGTNLTSATDDAAMIGNGTTWQAAAVPNCSSTNQAIGYDTSSNTFSCQTIAGTGISQSTGTGNLSYANACTTTPTQGYAYVLTGMTVTLTFTSQFACTSDSTAMISDALPSAIRPARTQVFLSQAQNAGSVTQACFALDTSGVLTWYQVASGQCATSGTWTASGSKGPLTLIGTSPFIASSSSYTYTLN